MTVRSRDLKQRAAELDYDDDEEPQRWSLPAIPWRKASGYGVWLLGCYFTALVFLPFLHWTFAVIVAGIGQLGLTIGQRKIWQDRYLYDDDNQPVLNERGKHAKERIPLLAFILLGIDGFFNIVGTAPIAESFHRWPPVVVIARIMHWQIQPLTGYPVLGISAILGIIICASAEYLMQDD